MITKQVKVGEMTMLDLTAYVRRCWSEARTAKLDISERLLRCDRQRRGIYDPGIAAEIKKAGNSEVYMMLTDIKCRAAEAWINDVMMSAKKVFSIRPTTEPDLPEELKIEIMQTVFAEVQMLPGEVVSPDAVAIRMNELYEQVTQQVAESAMERAERMENRIQDHLDESDYTVVQQDWVNDFVTYPTAFLAGPLPRRRRVQEWGPNWTPRIVTKEVLEFERFSPYDAFPGPGSSDVNDTFFIRRHRLSRKALQDCIGQPGYNDDQIKQALDLYGTNGLREWEAADSEKDWIDDKNTSLFQTQGKMTALEFMGPVSGDMLQQWGMKGVEKYQDYEANVWIIGPFTIRAVINPHPLGIRPISSACFRRVPGSIWGVGLPESMRDVQIMCNAAARALAGNMSIASGPQVEVTVDRLPPGSDLEDMYPWKIWQTTSDRTGSGQPAVRFFQPGMNAEALLGVYQYFQKVADEVTGVPNYIYGSTAVSGAGRTASGLSMLMENAAKGIKHAILHLDNAQAAAIRRTFDYLMKYDPDPMIKGDMQIVPVGIVATLIKEGVQERRQAFLQATTNPVDIQIMGPDRRAGILRSFDKDLELDPDDIAPDPKQVRQQQAAAAMQQQQQMAAQQQQVDQTVNAVNQPQQITFQRGPDGEIQGAYVDGGLVSPPQESVAEQLKRLERDLSAIEGTLQ